PEPLFLEEADQLKTIHHQLIGMGKTMIGRMIEAGEILTRVRRELPHGSWMPWVATHIPALSHGTINRYMRVYRRRDDPLLKDDPVRFMAEISGKIGELESNSTPVSNLNIESEISSAEVPYKAESEERIVDAIKSLEETSEVPQARRTRAVRREISP